TRVPTKRTHLPSLRGSLMKTTSRTTSPIYPTSFSNDPTTTDIYTLSLHDALPICILSRPRQTARHGLRRGRPAVYRRVEGHALRSEEHTSELQSHLNLVCRLLLGKKNTSAKSSTTSKTEDATSRPATSTAAST